MNAQASISEWENWMIDQRVDTIILDTSLTFLLHDKEGNQCLLKIESIFEFKFNNTSFTLNPLNTEEMAYILRLWNKLIKLVKIEEVGSLLIEFELGDCITVNPDDQYEAWQIQDRNSKVAVISLPGGGLG